MRELTVEMAQWLSRPAAQQALAALAGRDLRDQALLPLLSELQQQWSGAQASALVDQARLRQRAAAKFGEAAARMLFTDTALEQASGQRIARYRAARYAPFAMVADLGCGIGGDALALSEQVPALVALDLDPVRCQLAAHNLAVAGGPSVARVEEADWTRTALPDGVDAAFADPGRRVAGRRVFSLHQTEPPLAALLALQQRLPALGVKVMPGVADDELPPEAEVEFIAEGGTCKEGVLWFGALRRGPARTATVLDGAGSHTVSSDDPAPLPPLSSPRRFLWEPDPSVIRATLVAALALPLGAAQLDPQIAYLTSDEWQPSPLARAWPVLADAPFNLKALNRLLRDHGADVIAVKKRGSPIEPETFRRRLKSTPGGLPVTVFVTRCQDQPWMVLCGAEQTRVGHTAPV